MRPVRENYTLENNNMAVVRNFLQLLCYGLSLEFDMKTGNGYVNLHIMQEIYDGEGCDVSFALVHMSGRSPSIEPLPTRD